MRSSAPEGPIVPRAKQATPSGNSGTTACPAGGQPISQINRVPNTATKSVPSPQPKKGSSHSSGSSNKESSSRSLSQKNQHKTVVQQTSKDSASNSSTTKATHSGQAKAAENSPQPSKNRSKSPATVSSKQSTVAKPTVGKHPPGTTLAPNQANFGEYDDQEWDVGVGHLIIDLDADIAQADRGKMSSSSNSMNSSIEDKASLKMKIKRTKPSTKTSEAKHVIVKSESTPVGGNSLSQGVVSPPTPQHNGNAVRASSESGNSNRTPTTPRNIYKKEKRRPEVNGTVNPSVSTPSRTPALVNGPGSPVKDSRSGTSNGTVAKKEYSKCSPGPPISPQKVPSPIPQSPSAVPQQNLLMDKTKDPDDISSQGPAKKLKLVEEKSQDACVGTSVGTNTEPDYIGPCEPGTEVLLGGIVWQENRGVLVVNVTWRGKSYVGSLIDCTKTDWAPPRVCESPTSDMDSRTPKGRGKRGRSAAATSSTSTIPEVNVAETRSGKLRNAAKGRRGGASGTQRSSTPTPNPPSSPPRQENNGIKRKSCPKEDLEENKNAKRSRFSSSRSTPTNNSESSSPGPEQHISTSENDSEAVQVPRAPSPKLIQCPEPNCCKKYTHINGLKYHKSHGHKAPTSSDESEAKDKKRDKMSTSTSSVIENLSEINSSNVIKPSTNRPGDKSSQIIEDVPMNGPNSPSGSEGIANSVPVISNTTDKINVNSEVVSLDKTKPKTTSPEEPPPARQNVAIEKLVNSLPPSPVAEPSPSKLVQNKEPLHYSSTVSTIQEVQSSSIISPPSLLKVALSPLANDTTDQSEMTMSTSPVDLGSTSMSSLPVRAVISDKNSFSAQKPIKSEDINGVSIKEEDDSSIRESRSPAYSDISEANEPAPSMDDIDSKDFKDDKKMDHSMAGSSQYPYDLYFNSYGQPSPQYMMSMQQPSPSSLHKSAESVDMKSKDCKDVSQGNSDYMKIPPHYLYHYSQLYPSGYPNPYARENVYSDEEKPKVEMKECIIEDAEKGPTDLSRSGNHPSSSRSIVQCEKPQFNVKDHKPESSMLKDVECKMPIMDKRHQPEMNLRYGGPYDSRGSRLPSPHASNMVSVSLPSPHHAGTISPACIKEEKCDKRQDVKPEGVKPTMETTGPPPPPTSSAYYPPFPYPHVAFDPYRPIMPGLTLPSGFPPYNIPGHPSLGVMRYPMVSNGPEDLSRSTIPPGFYANPHKLTELPDRLQKSPSTMQSGLPCSLAKSNSPMAFASTESRMHHAALLSTSSPSLPISSNIPITSIASLHHAPAERKLLPHLGIPEGYPYNILAPGAQFPPHFPPLGLNPVGLGVPPNMTHLPK